MGTVDKILMVNLRILLRTIQEKRKVKIIGTYIQFICDTAASQLTSYL